MAQRRTPQCSETGEDDVLPRSIYDGPKDLEPDVAPELEDAAPPWAGLGETADAADRAAVDWTAALGVCMDRGLAAAAGVARLDERLRLMEPGARRAALERLAVVQAARPMCADGDPVDPFAMALDAARRRGRAGEDAPAVTAARRLARRLASEPGRRPARPARAMVDADAARPACADAGPPDAASSEPGRPASGRSDAEEVDAALRGAPPLVAAALALRCADPLSEASPLDAAAARLIAAARGCLGGASFAPVPARRRLAGPAPETRLAAFFGDVSDGACDALALIDDLAAWRARADAAVAAMKGPTPARMIALLARRPALTAPAAASALRLSDDAALRLLVRLTDLGLARELTGHARFRVWAARL